MDRLPILSFVAITDEPPEEVRAVGHDRMIVNIQPGPADEWLTPAKLHGGIAGAAERPANPYYEHRVEAA